MSAPAVLDLGELPPAGVAGDPPPARLPGRLWLLVIAAVVCSLAGAVPPAGAPVHRVFTVPVAGQARYLLDRGVLYLAGDGAVAGYRLSDGHQLWRSPSGEAAEVVGDPAAGGLVTRTDSGVVSVLDPRSGALRWQRGGVDAVAAAGDEVLLTTAGEGITALSVRTGEPRWWYGAPDGGAGLVVAPGVAGGPARILLVGEDPALTVVRLDPSTGAPVEQVNLAQRYPELAGARFRVVSGVVGGLLLVSGETAGGAREFAFDPTALALRWAATLPVRTPYAGDCAPALCLYGDGGTTLVDPATGRVLARGAWQFAVILPDGRVPDAPSPVGMLAGLVRPVVPQGLWQSVATTPVTVLVQPVRGPGGAWVGVLGRDGVTVSPVGRLPVSAVESCGSDGEYLVCQAGAGVLAFRLR